MQAREMKDVDSPVVQLTDLDGIRTAVVLSDIDRHSADRLHAVLEDAATGRTEFILSLQSEYCDSYGLAMIIAFARQIGEGCVIASNERIRRIIDIAGLQKVLRLADTVADAVDLLVSK